MKANLKRFKFFGRKMLYDKINKIANKPVQYIYDQF